jgi:Flp pilus assembly protein TadD
LLEGDDVSQSKKRRKKKNLSATAAKATALQQEESLRIYNQGILLQQQGQLAPAEAAYRKAISLHPEFAGSHNNLGNLLSQTGRWKAAVKAYRKALELAPGNAMLLSNIGNALLHQGKLAAAVSNLRQALDIDADHAYAHNNLGNALLELGRVEEAVEHLQRAAGLEPQVAEIHLNLGRAFCTGERFEQALVALNKGLKLDPGSAEGHANLGYSLYRLERTSEARYALLRALEFDPNNDKACALLGKLLIDEKRPLYAEEMLRKAVELQPGNADYCFDLGRALYALERRSEAVAAFRKAVALDAGNSAFHNNLGLALYKYGDEQGAVDSLSKAIQLQPDFIEAYRHLSMVKNYTQPEEELQTMQSLLRDGGLLPEERMHLHFALGKALDDLGRYQEAFQHFADGNTLHIEMFPYDIQETTAYVDKIIRLFQAGFIQEKESVGYRDSAPIIITGLPRSGKTLLEGLLAQHPQVLEGGEVLEFAQLCRDRAAQSEVRRYPDAVPSFADEEFADIGKDYVDYLKRRIQAPGSSRVCDTSPGNIFYVGMIRLCLPDARIIICRRKAKDNCVEIYKKYFNSGHNYGYDLATLGGYFTLHEQLLSHWLELLPGTIHEVWFEELVHDPESVLRGVLDFCGLVWEDAAPECLRSEIRKQGKFPSAGEVTQLWKRYKRDLAPLEEQLQLGAE